MGNVIGVSQLNGGGDGAHSMVLNGYKIQMNGDAYIHLLNTDNFGTDEWRYYCSIQLLGTDVIANVVLSGITDLINLIPGVNIDTPSFFFSYFAPPITASVRSANGSVFVDSDGDGLVDFDEIERFKTNPFSKDADADGKGAAWDNDSDNDGYCDYQEIGFVSMEKNNSQCGMFKPNVYPERTIPLCMDLTVAMLAKETISLNDRSTCIRWDGKVCRVATYASIPDETYGVTLGADAVIGDIYSAGDVWLRNGSRVIGHVETAEQLTKQESAVVFGNVVENSPRATAYATLYTPLMTNGFVQNVDFTISYGFVGETGREYLIPIIGLGYNTNFVFNSNSVLTIEGVSQGLAGALEFQSGAVLNMKDGAGLELHVGNRFQWNGTIVANNLLDAAQHIIIYYYGAETVHVQTRFAGTIIAPNAKVIIGQANKEFYGAVYAKSIVVHQDTKFTWVPYEKPITSTYVAMPVITNYNISFNL